MSMQITILGLGQIGASIGLRLSGHKGEIKRVGLDRAISTAKQAKRIDAIDEVKVNLVSAVRKADIVILAMPVDQVRETLEVIADQLPEDTVIMDTSPARTAVTDLALSLLPSGRSYIGLTPIINPDYLHESTFGLDAAHEDLFERGLIAITTGRGTPASAIKAATALTQMLGASPLFADPAEVDGMLAAIHALPQFAAAALLDATLDQPGWQETRKFAGRPYVVGTSAIEAAYGGETLRDAALLNAENTTRVLDRMIASLQAMRNLVAAGDAESLTTFFSNVAEGREAWLAQREAANWNVTQRPGVPASTGMLAQMFGYRPRRKPGEK